VEIQRAHSIGHDGDRLEFDGEGTLGPSSDGVEPAAEDVTFRVGSLTLKIPGGSFVRQVEHDEHDGAHERRDGGRKHASRLFSFRGVVDSMPVRAEIEIDHRGEFAFRLRARDANLGLMINPTPVGFSIGGDVGESSVHAEFDRHR